MCLLCNECLSRYKEYNLRKHCKTAHASFDTTFPLGSDARYQKILALISCYVQRHRTLFRACTEQQRATSASLRVAWIVCKKKDVEIVKECVLASVEEMAFLHNSKQKKAHTFLSLMENGECSAAICFLSYVFHPLNQLNMELQGRD